MSESESPVRLTANELEILRILWERGPSTVRDVHEALSPERPIGYTGALKFLQIMAAKGLVVRNEDQRAHVYEAAEPPEATKRKVAGDLLRRVFAGSASQLVMHALEGHATSHADIDEIRAMLDAYEQRKGGAK